MQTGKGKSYHLGKDLPLFPLPKGKEEGKNMSPSHWESVGGEGFCLPRPKGAGRAEGFCPPCPFGKGLGRGSYADLKPFPSFPFPKDGDEKISLSLWERDGGEGFFIFPLRRGRITIRYRCPAAPVVSLKSQVTSHRVPSVATHSTTPPNGLIRAHANQLPRRLIPSTTPVSFPEQSSPIAIALSVYSAKAAWAKSIALTISNWANPLP